jgi:hypothetical protein
MTGAPATTDEALLPDDFPLGESQKKPVAVANLSRYTFAPCFGNHGAHLILPTNKVERALIFESLEALGFDFSQGIGQGMSTTYAPEYHKKVGNLVGPPKAVLEKKGHEVEALHFNEDGLPVLIKAGVRDKDGIIEAVAEAMGIKCPKLHAARTR